MNQDSLIDAVRFRDAERVERLIEQGAPLEERDHRGATPLIVAAGSEQYVIAERLVAAGADPFAMDSLYITAAGLVLDSGLQPDTAEGAARQRLLAILRDQGVPLPPPTRADMPAALQDGTWPAHAAPPPLDSQEPLAR